ncbi:hypothetical protein TVAG_306460 [Trichomonas vaginalis G3]|uniref:Uncharacterized protein n=1 Tax=Trichomonas vaginalis (strain ATCC PRA-98 / G3) TaxID=412133 RepID=A2DND6_TRIV3|nr:hypothetical protein TVAGG3_1024630 [Trichomonas vaginalis G3]EAY18124.1 hypothetical protein TVAG_306460 [Trichomonas vaginalis G3]KAI5492401.1 hypothetical protein TVAGG3_1024630 [Trichomonas vaginalis G3]|eukprot:XP_001579110.1 hypothetical protein [Trichomonas vaginalis G3]
MNVLFKKDGTIDGRSQFGRYLKNIGIDYSAFTINDFVPQNNYDYQNNYVPEYPNGYQNYQSNYAAPTVKEHKSAIKFLESKGIYYNRKGTTDSSDMLRNLDPDEMSSLSFQFKNDGTIDGRTQLGRYLKDRGYDYNDFSNSPYPSVSSYDRFSNVTTQPEPKPATPTETKEKGTEQQTDSMQSAHNQVPTKVTEQPKTLNPAPVTSPIHQTKNTINSETLSPSETRANVADQTNKQPQKTSPSLDNSTKVKESVNPIIKSSNRPPKSTSSDDNKPKDTEKINETIQSTQQAHKQESSLNTRSAKQETISQVQTLPQKQHAQELVSSINNKFTNEAKKPLLQAQ